VLKFIPGPGSVIGSAVNAAMAGALTRTMGKSFIRFLYDFIDANGRTPSAEEIMAIFPSFYKNNKGAEG
jgi:uncharacterized protein (DUF697 family)